MRAEGVEFEANVHVGVGLPMAELRRDFDAVLLATGAEHPRDLPVPGRELEGIHFAMDFLPQQNRRVAGDAVPRRILATGKRVVIIGGGDTGADCLGTSHRQGAASVHQFEIQPMPPASRDASTPWPLWPLAVAHGKLARRRRSPRLGGRDHAVFGQRRRGEIALPPGWRRIFDGCRSGSAGDGIHRSGA